MGAPPSIDLRPADDGYATYYAEKLWNWIPEVHRDADFTALRPNVLRALIEVIGGDAATARRSCPTSATSSAHACSTASTVAESGSMSLGLFSIAAERAHWWSSTS